MGRRGPSVSQAPLDSLPGVGPRIAAKLRKLGLVTVRDLLEHRPRDYQRSVGESRIVDLFGEQEAVIVGEVRNVSLRRTRGRLTVLKAVVADESGAIPAVWFNQDWLEDKLLPGTRVRLRGQLRRNEFTVKSYDLNGASATPTSRRSIPAGEEITPPRMRALADRALGARAERARPAAGGAGLARGAAPARRRAARAPPAADARGGGGGDGGGSRSTSCSCSSSASRGGRASANRRWRRRSASPGSCSRAIAQVSRSR